MTPADKPLHLLSVETVAMMLDCSPSHVRRMSDAGEFPKPVKVGRLTRWREDTIAEWIKKGCKPLRKAS